MSCLNSSNLAIFYRSRCSKLSVSLPPFASLFLSVLPPIILFYFFLIFIEFQSQICCNEYEYLYGNVYIEYFDVLSAIHAKNHLSGRFFASKVLYPQFFLTLGFPLPFFPFPDQIWFLILHFCSLSLRTCKEFEQ